MWDGPIETIRSSPWAGRVRDVDAEFSARRRQLEERSHTLHATLHVLRGRAYDHVFRGGYITVIYSRVLYTTTRPRTIFTLAEGIHSKPCLLSRGGAHPPAKPARILHANLDFTSGWGDSFLTDHWSIAKKTEFKILDHAAKPLFSPSTNTSLATHKLNKIFIFCFVTHNVYFNISLQFSRYSRIRFDCKFLLITCFENI